MELMKDECPLRNDELRESTQSDKQSVVAGRFGNLLNIAT